MTVRPSLKTRAAARRAETAAAALDDFLRERSNADAPRPEAWSGAPSGSEATTPGFAAVKVEVTTETAPSSDAFVGRRTDATPCDAPLRLPQTDWLYHRLTVTGPADAVTAFQAAAAGAGTIPWQLDLASLEEDWFHRLVDPAYRSLSLPGARILAAQLREAVERRHALAVARVGRSRACPLDLHSLLPVPPGILALGPDHPDALVWMWERWGTTEALRHVSVVTGEGRDGQAPAGPGWPVQFWSADWTPWRAFERIRADWPMLRFDLQPRYT